MSDRERRMSRTRIASVALLVFSTFLWAGTQAHAQPKNVGVGFASAATEESTELTNAYQDLVTLTITAPQDGYIVLTGSGYLDLTTFSTSVGPVWGQVSLSIGTISGSSNNENEIGVEIPRAEGGGYSYKQPFSITTVIPVTRGSHSFYMVGIRDPNTAFSTWYATNLKLTALFVNNRID